MGTLILPGQERVEADKILYLESESNYTIIHKTNSPKKVIAAKSLCYIQEGLNPLDFIRINRRQVININMIGDFWGEKGFLNIQLRNGPLCRTSRRRTVDVMKSIFSQKDKKRLSVS
ncbi:LytTR family transcriptional regulator [Marinilongibacter aquaticus]|uniref:LytTR family DNA-binding domain-containing protein n=1 Tax=Marinilongibacter aquaticus TaxID=2975157 RepID=UPI0021BD94C3|nr:LytTR family DNA-binding domain-containing protein [Marinilongibacter aquaticus]UBM58002.1 LytTR family transcriptional regulator [Marinilongibacter aquaticus]